MGAFFITSKLGGRTVNRNYRGILCRHFAATTELMRKGNNSNSLIKNNFSANKNQMLKSIKFLRHSNELNDL